MQLLLALILSAPTALAAEVCDLPPQWRGSVGLGWWVEGDRARLEERGFIVGERTARRHDLRLDADVAVWQGVVLGAELPIVLDQRIVWFEAREMSFDPSLGEGSYVASSGLGENPTLSGGGPAGPVVSLTLAPFQRGRAARAVPTDLLLEVGYRLQDKSHFYRLAADGRRGGGNGADALRIRAAFARQVGRADPYTEVRVERAFTVPTPLRDDQLELIEAGALVRPASRVDLRAGVELPIQEQGATALLLDLRGRFGYRSWQDIPSGVELPDVLAASKEVLVTQSESVSAMAGLGMRLRVERRVDFAAGIDLGSESPYRVEHPYAVRTAPGLVAWQGGVSARVWLDDPLWSAGGSTAPR